MATFFSAQSELGSIVTRNGLIRPAALLYHLLWYGAASRLIRNRLTFFLFPACMLKR